VTEDAEKPYDPTAFRKFGIIEVAMPASMIGQGRRVRA
jgi:hypothetical protein